MKLQWIVPLVAITLVAACGTEEASDRAEAGGRTTMIPAGPGAVGPSPASPAQTGGPVVEEAPDPCQMLTSKDVEELLGVSPGPGRSYDAGGWNCVYDAGDPRERLVLDIQRGRDLSVESTQIGMSIEACAAEVVERFDDLGVDAAVYRTTAQQCDDDLFLWVATPVTYRGRPSPDFERAVEGPLHLLVTLSPPRADRAETVEILSDAARRALARLGG